MLQEKFSKELQEPKELQQHGMHDKPVQEKKVYPFFFLCGLAFVFFLGVHFWTDWQVRSEAKRIEEIVQSQDIANLILGEGFNKKEFSEELENMKKAHTKERNLDKNLEEVMLSFANVPDFQGDDVGLAMQGIRVSSGAHGMEEWALFAKWATMRQKTAVLQVENPLMWYRTGKIDGKLEADTKSNTLYLQDDEDKIVIEARHGLVYENNSKVLLQEGVVASQRSSLVQGDMLSYDNKERIAVFPQNPSFMGEGLAGRAEILSWNMTENKIYGSGKVYVEWTPAEAQKKKEG